VVSEEGGGTCHRLFLHLKHDIENFDEPQGLLRVERES
jgi:hypothetical protein